MKQPVFYLRDERVRDNLIDYIRKLPVNDALPLVVKFSEADRTLAQNDLFHALCGDTAKQLQWAGKSRDLASWKVLYVSGHAIATGKPGEVVPGLEAELARRTAGESPGTALAKPLYDTGKYIAAITHVVRDKDADF